MPGVTRPARKAREELLRCHVAAHSVAADPAVHALDRILAHTLMIRVMPVADEVDAVQDLIDPRFRVELEFQALTKEDLRLFEALLGLRAGAKQTDEVVHIAVHIRDAELLFEIAVEIRQADIREDLTREVADRDPDRDVLAVVVDVQIAES